MNKLRPLVFKISLCCLLFLLACDDNNNLFETSIKIVKVKQIETNSDSTYTLIYGIKYIGNNELIISDKNNANILVLDRDLQRVKIITSRGEGPGMFKSGPSSIAFNNKDKIAVVDYTLPRINVYDNEIVFLSSLSIPLPIIDIEYYDTDKLIVACPIVDNHLQAIYLYDNLYKLKFSFRPVNLIRNQYLFNMYSITVNKKLNRIVVMYLYRNLIQLYDFNGNLQSEIEVEELRELSPKKKRSYINEDVPEKHILNDIACDSAGNFFVLGGHYSKNKNKEIYVYNKKGIMIDKIKLLEETRMIEIDNENHLFAVSLSRNKLTKYKIIKENFYER